MKVDCLGHRLLGAKATRAALGVLAVNRPPNGLLGAVQGLAGTGSLLLCLGDCVAGSKHFVDASGMAMWADGPRPGMVVLEEVVVVVVLEEVVIIVLEEVVVVVILKEMVIMLIFKEIIVIVILKKINNNNNIRGGSNNNSIRRGGSGNGIRGVVVVVVCYTRND